LAKKKCPECGFEWDSLGDHQHVSMTPQAEEDRYRAEVADMYYRFGWKWVALAYMTGRVVAQGKQLPGGFLEDLTLARTSLESGCSSVCDVTADLRGLENRLFEVLLHISEGEVHTMLELISKAMSGTLQQKDVDLSPLKVVLADTTIPSVCSPRT
jgi:hypothetical protein